MNELSNKRLKTSYQAIEPFTTKDGSIIRELMHPSVHGNQSQSLAEATLPVGGSTLLHRHSKIEEIYHITAGHGRMTLGNEQFDVSPGDTICIPPGTAHALTNTDNEPLRLLCCSTPPYTHEDTDILAATPPSDAAP